MLNNVWAGITMLGIGVLLTYVSARVFRGIDRGDFKDEPMTEKSERSIGGRFLAMGLFLALFGLLITINILMKYVNAGQD